jgi:hypothetical protein
MATASKGMTTARNAGGSRLQCWRHCGGYGLGAFICNNSHITALAVYAARNRIGGHTDAKTIGEILHAENVKSVNYLYGESARPSFELSEWAAFHKFSEVQIVKAAHCLDYQSCEHPGWADSQALRIVQAIIANTKATEKDLPEYEAAEWEISPRLPSPAEVIDNPKAWLPDSGHGNGEGNGHDNGPQRGR